MSLIWIKRAAAGMGAGIVAQLRGATARHRAVIVAKMELAVRFLVAVAVSGLVAGEAMAQVVAPGVPTSTQGARVPRTQDWTIGVGFAPVYSPAWQGSRDQALSIFPDLRVNYRDAVYFSVPDGLG